MTILTDATLAVTVVLTLGAVAALVLRRGSPALRHAAWRATLAGVWLAPVAVIAAGMLPVQRPEIAVPMPRYAPTPRAIEAEVAPVEEPVAEVTADTGRALAEPAAPKPPPVAAILLSLWGAGALVALVALSRDATALRTLLTDANGAPGDRPATVEFIADRLGLRRLPRIVRSPEVSVPAVAGWLRPTLVLPADGRADEAALIHELAHVQRGDLPTLTAGRLTAAVWWWHPLAWLMLRGLAATAEEACDDVVLALTGARREYARMLTDWAERTSVAGAVNCGTRGKGLVARVRRVLDERVRPVMKLSALARIAVVGCALIAVVAAGMLHVRGAEGQPAPTDAGEQVTITGRVVGPDGEAIAGAHVGFFSPWARRWVNATSGADGRFELSFSWKYDAERYSVVAVADGYAPTSASARPGEPVEIELSEGTASVARIVQSPDGIPLAAVKVWVSRTRAPDQQPPSSRDYFGDWEHAPAVTTADDGTFRIGGLAPGSAAELRAEGEGLADWRSSRYAEWPVAGGGTPMTITMHPEAVIAGRVTRDGEPVAGVRVGAQSLDAGGIGWAEDVTADDGSYRIDGLAAGTWNAALEAPEGYTAVAHEGLELEAGDRAAGIDFELIEGCLVRGTVTWADTGEPVPEAREAARVLEDRLERTRAAVVEACASRGDAIARLAAAQGRLKAMLAERRRM